MQNHLVFNEDLLQKAGNTAPIIKEICEMYWSCTNNDFDFSVEEIAQAYSMPSHNVSTVALQYSWLANGEWECNYCKGPYVFKNRTDYRSHKGTPPLHTHIHRECEQIIAEATRQRKKLELVKRIEELIPAKYKEADLGPKDPQTIKDYFHLYTLILKQNKNKNPGTITPLGTDSNWLPTMEMNGNAIKRLLDNNHIYLSPTTPEGSVFEKDNKMRYYIAKAEYLLNYEDVENLIKWLSTTFLFLDNTKEYIDDLNTSYYIDEIYETLVEYATDMEVVDAAIYLERLIDSYGYSYGASDAALEFIRDILAQRTRSELCYFLWAATRDTVAYIQQSSIPPQNLINCIPKKAWEKSMFFTKQGWKPSVKYDIYRYHPQSEVLQILEAVLYKARSKTNTDQPETDAL